MGCDYRRWSRAISTRAADGRRVAGGGGVASVASAGGPVPAGGRGVGCGGCGGCGGWGGGGGGRGGRGWVGWGWWVRWLRGRGWGRRPGACPPVAWRDPFHNGVEG